MTTETTETTVPLARLDLYEQAIILTKFEAQSTITYPVSIHDLAAIFGSLPKSSGFLPRNTLFHGRRRGKLLAAIYIPPKIAAVRVEETMITIPLPPAVFIGCGKQYDIHAVKQYPNNKHAPLYRYPTPNVWNNGSICAGDTPFPTCRLDTINAAFRMFIESGFNLHLVTGKCKSFPKNVIEFWKTLEDKKEFPLSELILSATSLRTWI